MALTVGSRLGHYDVTALIGEGGMGQVYQATDTKLHRRVALKTLPEAFSEPTPTKNSFTSIRLPQPVRRRARLPAVPSTRSSPGGTHTRTSEVPVVDRHLP